MIPLDLKLAPPRGSQVGTKGTDVEFNCGENDSGERSRAIMALLCEYSQVCSVNPRPFHSLTFYLVYPLSSK